ncbi:uncharacterized protein [Diadema antillarum]|uniref:uncharacterized protein n=1 Tax=Diadema antillarum TaxID=105358 RepID=UPI003A86F979
MASGFGDVEDALQGAGCKGATDGILDVNKEKNLCHRICFKNVEGATNKTKKSRTKLRCEKHETDMDFFCRSHDVGVCSSCITVRHQPPCFLMDLYDVIMERKEKITSLSDQTTDGIVSWRKHADHITDSIFDARKHFESVAEEVKLFVKDVLQKDRETVWKEEQDLIQDADDEIRKIKEKLELQLKNLSDLAKRSQELVQQKSCQLLDSLKELPYKTNQSSKEALHQSEDLMLDNEKLLDDGQKLMTSLIDFHEKRASKDTVDSIARTVQTVRFLKGNGDNIHDSRIDWGLWELTDTIAIPQEVKFPGIVGYISEDEVVVSDFANAGTYVTDMNTKKTEKVAEGQNGDCIVSCVVLDDEKIACGKSCLIGASTGYSSLVSIYDRKWQLVKEHTLPSNTAQGFAVVDVAVHRGDPHGVILVAETGQSTIHVLNHRDGEILDTITIQDKIRIRGVLPTGDIVAHRGMWDNTLLVVDGRGGRREITHSKTIRNVAVDPVTSALYVSCYVKSTELCVIDQMSVDGGVVREVASFHLSGELSKTKRRDHIAMSDVILTHSGKLIACDARNILVFRKAYAF